MKNGIPDGLSQIYQEIADEILRAEIDFYWEEIIFKYRSFIPDEHGTAMDSSELYYTIAGKTNYLVPSDCLIGILKRLRKEYAEFQGETWNGMDYSIDNDGNFNTQFFYEKFNYDPFDF